MHRTAIFLLGLLAAVCSVSAQTTTGDILGVVLDSSGAVIVDAKVTVRNLETNAVNETLSSSTGGFRIPLLPAGSYEVTVEKQGFSR